MVALTTLSKLCERVAALEEAITPKATYRFAWNADGGPVEDCGADVVTFTWGPAQPLPENIEKQGLDQ